MQKLNNFVAIFNNVIFLNRLFFERRITIITGSLQTKKGKKGETYYAVLNLGKNKYKWINLKLDVKNNKKLARQKLNELLVEYDNSPCMFEKILFTDYIKEWLKREESQVDIITLEGYRQYAEKHIIPYFEHLRLNVQDVSTEHLEDYYFYKSKGGRLDEKPGGLSNRTIKLHSIVINLVFKDAFRRNLIRFNPNERARMPKNTGTNFKGSFYTAEQINMLLDLFDGTLMRDMIYISCLYGLRRSELMGLKWSAINFSNDTLMIQHTVVMYDSTVVQKDKTKNQSSNRCYPLLPEIKEILQKIKAKQEDNKKLFGDCYIDSGYIFTREDGNVFHPSYVSHRLRKVLAESELPPIRWHDLRHTCASLLLSKGWSMKDISEWLGHSNTNSLENPLENVEFESFMVV